MSILNFFKSKKIIVTHDGNFHADEIFAIATLSLVHDGRIKIQRTRETHVLASADYVLDVGQIYNPKIGAYDHHQLGGAGKRENGIEYATFGLIWKDFGSLICGSDEVAKIIDERLVQPIDANDNGQEIVTPLIKNISPYRIQSIIGTRLPSWREYGKINVNREFKNLVAFAKDILVREIEKTKDNKIAEERVLKEYSRSQDKKIIILNENYPFEEVLVQFPEPLFVVSPRPDGTWRVATIPIQKGSFTLRKTLPSHWAGLKDEAIRTVTHIDGALFCHRALFLAVAKDKESAIKMALLALKS